MNANLLKAAMDSRGDSAEKLAKEMHIHRNTLWRKINGTAQFTQKEIFFLKERYDFNEEQLINIFFANELS